MIGSAADPINPGLGPLQNNGGPTLTIAPLPDSPAIDHGGPDPVGDDYSSIDQTGDPRIVAQPYSVPAVGGDGRDIGAVELLTQTPTILIVNSTADSSQSTAVLTLREAIETADGTFRCHRCRQARFGMGHLISMRSILRDRRDRTRFGAAHHRHGRLRLPRRARRLRA